jgi:uncharacterized protein
MLCVDISVLVYAHRAETARHPEYLAWISRARTGPEVVGVPDVIVAGFLRLVTNPRIFPAPSPITDALAFARGLLASPSTVPMVENERQRELFFELCSSAGATGDRVPDAFLASLAIERNATLITADRGFGRYPGLAWRHPLDHAADR